MGWSTGPEVRAGGRRRWWLFGVNPDLQGWMWDTGRYPAEGLWRYMAYGFFHLGPMQAMLVVVITAALGKACAERLGSGRKCWSCCCWPHRRRAAWPSGWWPIRAHG